MHGGGLPVGNINLRGKKFRLLSCGCCAAIDVRDEVLEKEHKRDIAEAMRSICSDGAAIEEA